MALLGRVLRRIVVFLTFLAWMLACVCFRLGLPRSSEKTMGKGKFQELWITNERYKDWIRVGKNEFSAHCNACKRSFELGNMGEAAVRSHLSGPKHVANFKRLKQASENPINSYFSLPSASTGNNDSTLPYSAASQESQSQLLKSVATSDNVWKAEIMWAMKVITSHFSYNSCTGIEKLFQAMFPDSNIAKSFTCGEKKCAYIVCHGLAPFFHKELVAQLQMQKSIVLLFDESLNSFAQNKQLDIHVRFYDEATNLVTTRYFTSVFLGHSTADIMVESFISACSELNLIKLTQLSMDGPNVNWSFYQKLLVEISNGQPGAEFIDIGSCGLHILHNAFRSGFEETGWDLSSFFASLYTMFHDTPARREDFTAITGSDIFSSQICRHRWVENVKDSVRARLVLDSVKKYVTVQKDPKKYTVPQTKSFQNVREACSDVLLLPKLHFFESVAFFLRVICVLVL